jgi:hypothetical protein
LQFVVITLIAEMPVARGQAQAGDAFDADDRSLRSVLLLSAIVNAPWRGIVSAAVIWGSSGLAGIVYEVIVVRRMRTQTLYAPPFEDWLFHVLLPCAAYATVAASAYAILRHAHAAMFVLGAEVLLLLFIGIHNTWGAVTYHVFVSRPGQKAGRTR